MGKIGTKCGILRFLLQSFLMLTLFSCLNFVKEILSIQFSIRNALFLKFKIIWPKVQIGIIGVASFYNSKAHISDGSGTRILGFGSAIGNWVLKGKLNKAFFHFLPTFWHI